MKPEVKIAANHVISPISPFKQLYHLNQFQLNQGNVFVPFLPFPARNPLVHVTNSHDKPH